MKEADQKKVNAVMAIADYLGVKNQIEVIEYSAESVQVEWRNPKTKQLIHRDYTFANSFVKDFEKAPEIEREVLLREKSPLILPFLLINIKYMRCIMWKRGENKVILMGRAGKDAEVRYTPNRTAIASLTLATEISYSDNEGKEQKETEWHDIVIFGKKAEAAGKYFKRV